MKKTRMTTKVLSMLLTVIMLFSTISVGIIVPDAKVKANAAEVTVNSLDELSSAITTANGTNDTVTIKLGAKISHSSTEISSILTALPTITGDVILDFNGNNIEISYTISSNNPKSVHFPAGNSSAQSFIDNGFINVGAGGKLQLINSSSTAATLYAYAMNNNGKSADETHDYASASLIVNKGTLIVGDKADATKNNFTLYAHASARMTNDNLPGSDGRKSATVNCYTITLNGAGAIFQMYGGTVKATGVARGKRGNIFTNGTYGNLTLYALNIESCNTAEIYGGTISIPQSTPAGDSTGVSNAAYSAFEPSTMVVSAIRCNTPHLYIFGLTCDVYAETGSDTSAENNTLYTSCIYATSDTNAPYLYGGKFNYNTRRAGGNSTASNAGYVVRGAYKSATSGTLIPSAVTARDAGFSNPGDGGTGSGSLLRYTVIPTTDGLAENALNVFSYDTFRRYANQYTNATKDGYYGSTIATNAGTTSVPTAGKYLRNGYVHNGWKGTTTVGGTFDAAYANPSVSGIASNGGVLYVAPTWEENKYNITYSSNPAIATNSLTDYSNCLREYKISDTAVIGAPTNPAYNFAGWKVVSYTPAATDTKTDAWDTESIYSANTSVNGKTGKIELQAQWTPKEFTATFKLNGGSAAGADTYELPYTISSGFTFPSSFTAPEHYKMPVSFTVDQLSGSWNSLSTVYDGGSRSPANYYGDVTFNTDYTPVLYTITYVDESDNYITEQDYDVENPIILEVRSKDGHVFKHWEVVETDGNWDATGEYSGTIPAGTLYGNVTLRRVLAPVTYYVEIEINEDEGESYTGELKLDYLYDYTLLVPGVPEKSGYRFLGWKVIDASDKEHLNKWIIGETFPGVIDPANYDKAITLPMKRVGSVKIEPVWSDPVGYKVTLEGAGGNVPVNSISYNVTETVTLPTAVRDGYIHTGWQVVDEGGNWFKGESYNIGTYRNMYGNVTLQATWTENTYTITYEPNGGFVSNTTQNYDIHSVKLAEPTREGYVFGGWQVVGASGNWKANEIYSAGTVPTEMFGNVRLRAIWNPKEYTITFPSDSANGVIKYTVADAPTEILPYEQDGYRFNHWVVNRVIGESNWTYGDVVDAESMAGKYGNIEVEADLSPIEYTYKVVGIKGEELASGTYTIKDTITLPNFVANGYRFSHWKVQSVTDGAWVNAEYAVGDTLAGSGFGNVVFAPVTEKIEYTIKFIPDGGNAINDILYTVESEVRLPNPNKAGHDFAGWEITSTTGNWTGDDALTGTLAAGLYGDVTLTAKWTPRTYTVTWKTASDEKKVSVKYGETPVVPEDIDTSRAADAQYTYTFSGWAPVIAPVTGNITYTAQYTRKLNSYTVTWLDENGNMLSADTYEYGRTPVYNNGINPEKAPVGETYYRFIGWTPAVEMVTGNATYKATFVAVENPATVNWVIDGKTYVTKWENGATPSYVGTPIKPDAEGYTYTFSGWDKTIAPVESGKEYTYVAQFNKTMQIYTATLDLNGGKLADSSATTINYNLNVLNLKAAVKDGYTFLGWKVSAASGAWTDTEKVYPAGAYVDMWGNVEFVAVFEINEYSITIIDGATTITGKYIITDNAAILSFAETGFEDSREGYALTGWTVTKGEGSWIISDVLALDKTVAGAYGNVTLEPVWTEKVYTITWVSGGVSQVIEYRYGEIVDVYSPISKAGYAAEWKNADKIPTVMPAENLTFTASYTPIQYYLRFETGGGDPIENISYTIQSASVLPTPTREGAKFAGWKVSAGNGSWVKSDVYDAGFVLTGTYGNATLTAQWEYDLYTVTWVAGDVTRVTYWYYGAVPSYNGIPTKASDDKYSYSFTGWDKPIKEVTGNIIYTAVFEETERLFVVKWDIDGYIAEAYTLTVQYGTMPVYAGPVPEREATEKYEFRFIGWTPEISEVTGDITYSAQFEAIAKLQGLRIDKTAVFLDIDEISYLTAVIIPSTANNNDVEWISQNENVATIDSTGKITAVAAGSAVIRVQSKDGAYKAYCIVQVAPIVTEYILISAAGVSTTRRPGEAIQLYATIMPDNATNKNIIWTSSNPAVATVDQSGFVVYGSEEGTAVITAISDGYASGSIKVITTLDETLIEDNVQTYVVMFLQSSSSYIIGGETYDNINVVLREGDTLEFLLAQPHFATLNGAQFDRDVDGVYRIKNIDRNYTVYALERDDIGMEQPEEPDEKPKETFFDKLKAFFRSIVEFFRNLFS